MTVDDLDAFPATETNFPATETRVGSAARSDPDDAEDLPEEHDVETYGPLPTGVIWASKNEGLPHIVTVVADPRGRRLQCICTSAAIRGDCWAVQETHRLFGWPQPERT